jgi:probable rRNA maturation factor
MVTLLDSSFRYTRADVPFLVPASRPRARRQLQTSVGDDLLTALPPGELSIVFLTDAALAELHGSFLNDPSLTDVITFEADPLAGTAGEICVSVDTACRYAAQTGQSFADELTLYLVHGLLHLAGYDDLVPTRKRRMRLAERRAMNLLREQAGVPEFCLQTRKRR